MEWLLGGGEMGKYIRTMDWSKTPLGPIEKWPQSLKTAVNLCLNSTFPISIVWGEDHSQIYNDGYWHICGEKHPRAMGENFRVNWEEAWSIIGDIFEQALNGKASYLENQRVFIERFGYREETFFTFSYSPISGENGEVLGIFHPVTETTQRMLSERRGRVIREFAARTSTAQTIDEVSRLAINCLSDHPGDLPFVLLYLFNENNEVELKAFTGLPTEPSTFPIKNTPLDEWPFNQIKDEHIIELNDLTNRFQYLICQPYPEPINTAILLPIFTSIKKGLVIAGVSARRKLDENYRVFYEMLQDAMTLAITKAGAYEQEKKRAEALAEVDKAKTVFFNNVSHEFRTPLTLMLSPLEELLAKNNVSDDYRSLLNIVYRNCVRLLKLVNNLLDFSRIESQRMEASFEPVDLAAFTIDLASNFRAAIEKSKMQFIVDCDNLDNNVAIYKEMWEKIVLNLLSNAFKYTLAGSIKISLKSAGDFVELTVSDTGVGIPCEELPKIFERFYRVKGTQGRTHEGTGIGLALVQELVKLHNGSIHVASQAGEGTTFIVKIPYNKEYVTSNISKTKNQYDLGYTKAFIQESLGLIHEDTDYSVNKHAATKEFKRIILAEDNTDMRHYITKLLADNYIIEAFTNGKDALDAAIANPPQLILSDIMMPVMDGLELVKQVRRIITISEIPIILLSARAGQESLVTGIDTGADDYLIKPFAAKELLARVKQQINMHNLRQETTRQKNDFLSHITHDLRAPLNAIIGYSSLLETEKPGHLTAQQKEFLGYIITSSNHLLQLINDLMDLAKAKAGKIEFREEVINLESIVNEVVTIFKNMANEKNIQLAFKVHCHFATAKVDPLRLKQIIYNYLSNAIKFTPANGKIMVKLLADKNNTFRIDVKDTGVGIKSEDIDKLFVDFQQLNATSDEHAGTGLGLALTKRIVEAQNGKVEVISKFGKGSTFSVILPRNPILPQESIASLQ